MRRRSVLIAGGATLLIGVRPVLAAGVNVVAVRVWPAADYTRVAIEHDSESLRYTTTMLSDPARFVIDLHEMTLNDTLRELIARISADDPYLQSVRVGQFQPDIVRIVFDLKQAIKPQVFSLPEIAQYKNRLVIDLYPEVDADPLMAFLENYEKTKATPVVPLARKPVVERLVTIALDPGHGGEDPGAIGRRGTYEKDVVLSIARRLKKRIDDEPNMRAYMTRNGDYFVPLHARVQRARRVQADLFISVHADAWISPTAKGSSVFALSEKGASSAAARWMANKENSADLVGGINIRHQDRQVAEVLLDMSTTAQIKNSLQLGQALLTEIGGINALHKRRVEQAGFAVLRAPDIPSVLVETAFISNPDEERRLRDSDYQEQMADAIMEGIRRYFRANPPLAKSRMM